MSSNKCVHCSADLPRASFQCRKCGYDAGAAMQFFAIALSAGWLATRTMIHLSICALLIAASGCSVTESWMRSYVAVHDAADTVLTAKTNLPPVIVTPPADKPATTILPDPTVKYNGGNEAADGGFEYEIWQHNWHGMNIRVHANPGEGRIAGIPIAGKWYPINMSIMPKDIVTMTRTATGATFTAKDFTAPSGQRYRIEAMKADGIGTVDKVRRLDLPESKFGGAVLIWYATIE